MSSAPLFIAIDWGTSNLRAFLVDAQGIVLDRKQSDQGMLGLLPDEFEQTLRTITSSWNEYSVPIYMAGMVGSKGGWKEIPYLQSPLALSDLTKSVAKIDTSLSVDVFVVPGVQGVGVGQQADVMRGEETQLLGLMSKLTSENANRPSEVFFSMPGTHCKWGRIENGVVKQFSTTFSGELYAKLSQESSLIKGVKPSEIFDSNAFQAGLEVSKEDGGLLHHLFSVRSRQVTGEMDETSVYDYLSGVIVGNDVNEMSSCLHLKGKRLYVIGSSTLAQRYEMALIEHDVSVVSVSAEEASILGLLTIAKAQ